MENPKLASKISESQFERLVYMSNQEMITSPNMRSILDYKNVEYIKQKK